MSFYRLDKIKKLASRYPIKRLLVFTLGCALFLLFKIASTNIFIMIGLSVQWAYLLCHVFLLFFSFYYHSTFTFVFRAESFRALLKAFVIFFNSVILLKLIDYAVVVTGSKLLLAYLREQTNLSKWQTQMIVSLCILFTSGIIFIIRYFIYQYIFTDVKHNKPGEAPETGKNRKLDYYTGPVKYVYCGYVRDEEIKNNAASGGIVSGLLLSMLNDGIIDGALTYAFVSENGEFKVKPRICVNKEELLATQGSIYYSFPALGAETMKLIHEFDGRLAIVGLPCTISAVRKMLARDEALSKKIVVLLGLFCGHTSKPELIETVLKRKGFSPADIKSFRFRRGLWRGYTEALTTSNQRLTWKTSLYTLYQNLFIKSAPQCLSCFDHYAEEADISTGDIWLMKYKHAAAKPSIFAVRTEIGEQAVESAIRKGLLNIEDVDQHTLFDSNKRAAIFHKAISARARVAKLYGIKIKVPANARKARWNEILAGLIALGLYRFSMSGKEHLLFRMPRFPLKCLLYVFKGLTNF